jgi:hypothetical protein
LFLRELDPGIEEWVLGLAIGAFALSSFLLQYPLGVWLDRRSMREVLVAVLWIAMIGNLAYFLSTQVWMVSCIDERGIVFEWITIAGHFVEICLRSRNERLPHNKCVHFANHHRSRKVFPVFFCVVCFFFFSPVFPKV